MSALTASPPHGFCECNGERCCRGRGPAAFEVTREGRTMRVCTRCDLPSDEPTKRLLVTDDEDAEIYRDFDALGLLSIVLGLAEARRPEDLQ